MAKASKKQHKGARHGGKARGGPAAVPARLNSLLQQVSALLDEGKAQAALEQIEAGRGLFARYDIFQALLAQSYGAAGQAFPAAVHARRAVEIAPLRSEYQALAAICYARAGFLTFAYHARQAWWRLAPRDDSLTEDFRLLDDEYRSTVQASQALFGLLDARAVEKALYRLDEGRWALNQGDWPEAARLSKAAAALVPAWPPPRNNLSLALYAMGRLSDASAEAEAVLRDVDPDNVHAQANLVRFYLSGGQEEQARLLGERLAGRPLPEDPDTAIKLIEALALLNRDQDVERLISQYKRRERGLSPRLYTYWGIAAANLGRRAVARRRLQEAIEAGGEDELLQATLSAVERGQPGRGIAPRFSYTSHFEWLSREGVEDLLKVIRQQERRGNRDERAWADLLRRHPQMVPALRKMLYEETDPDGRASARSMLAQLRTPEAIAALREFIAGREGDQSERTHALQALQQSGVLEPDVAVPMWIEGRQETVESHLLEISDNVDMTAYPTEAWEALEQGLTAQRAGRDADAERAYERMLQIAPQAKEAYNNLAVLYAKRGEQERVDEYVDKALAIDPLYVFPVTARARQALERDDIAEAHRWLEPLGRVRRFHTLGFIQYQKTLAEVAIAEKDYEAAHQHLGLLEQIAKDDPDIGRVRSALTFAETLGAFPDRLREMDARYQRRRQRQVMPADPALAECFGLLTKGDMMAIAETLGIGRMSALKKAELYEYMMARFADPDFVGQVVGRLKEPERAALRDVLAHGGAIAREDFVRAHGDFAQGERTNLEFHGPRWQSVMGRLRARGLLFEGTTEGRVVLALPRELQSMLPELLDKPIPDGA